MWKIMCVDDENDILYSIKLYLEYSSMDYHFIGLNSGKACIEYLKNGDLPDFILLDIMMPEMSGWEVYDAIRQNQAWRHIPIVFFSGISDNITKNIDGIIGDGFIQKPIEPEELIHQIEHILNKNY